MNLRAIANRATAAINPNIAGQALICTGYTTAASGKRAAGYSPATDVSLQLQALTKKEVEHLDALNFSSVTTTAYVNRSLTGVDRVKQTGGDLLLINGDTWLVVAVLEDWSGRWCKVALQRQLG